MNSPDTIVAVASAPGRGAVGVIRVSGSQVPQIALRLLGALPAPRHARFCSFLDSRGHSIDAGLALYFPAPASYTGEHVMEVQGHGGALIVDLVLKRLLELGCRIHHTKPKQASVSEDIAPEPEPAPTIPAAVEVVRDEELIEAIHVSGAEAVEIGVAPTANS